jgi:hypothetical protein
VPRYSLRIKYHPSPGVLQPAFVETFTDLADATSQAKTIAEAERAEAVFVLEHQKGRYVPKVKVPKDKLGQVMRLVILR